MTARKRIAVGLLSVAALALAAWKADEGDGPVSVRPDGVEVHHPYVPVQGDRPTIGHGSTFYENGQPVKLTDPPITRKRAEVLALNLLTQDEKRVQRALDGVELYPEEMKVYVDFAGQFGIGNLSGGSIKKRLLARDYRGACRALLAYKFVAGYDCSTMVNGKPNKICFGVWTRQQKRYADCEAAQ